MTPEAIATVEQARHTIGQMLRGNDKRLLVADGPCSIHDIEAALEFARRYARLIPKLQDRIFSVMRGFFEKPRSNTGWPGLICDPYIDGSNDGEEGLRRARQLLVEINSMGVPVVMEVIDPIVPQYLAELIALATVGARTSESSTQRRLASGLSMPVGFKNGTDGDIQGAINAVIAAQYPQSFFGIDYDDGQSAVVHTTGNSEGFLILRGGRSGTNFDAASIWEACIALEKKNLRSRVMVDCNHAQSGGDPQQQEVVWKTVVDQLPQTEGRVLGLLIESFLVEGRQPLELPADLSKLTYGQSVTDACMDWEATEQMLHYTYEKLA